MCTNACAAVLEGFLDAILDKETDIPHPVTRVGHIQWIQDYGRTAITVGILSLIGLPKSWPPA